ncbi:unnamed protein product [Linum trigynum]|uniref:Pentatricopeptide repeat-containing protein n=1 Tax=Linum trigynum TaxID=586398 RepID=A0AAV2G7F7_9ROSI
MNALRFSCRQLQQSGRATSKAITGVASFSAYCRSRTSPPALSSASPDSLASRVWRSGHPSISIVKVIEQWLDEAKQVKQSELQQLIRDLRRHRRQHQALQLSEWMRDQSCYNDSPGDIAVRLDLISKVRGSEQAEQAFEAIPENMRNFQVYGALLNCYSRKKCVEKAEATMDKMRELNFLKAPLPYNVMLTLYFHTKNHEKLDALVKEMEENGIACGIYTYNIQLNAYGATSRFQEMEELLGKLERDTVATVDWHSYFVGASAYLKAGEKEKAVAVMKKLEGLVTHNSRKFCYEVLITLYANAGDLEQVCRIWDLYKQMGKIFNSGYLCMISSLLKLDEIARAENVWEEWLLKKRLYDVRIANQMVIGYSRKGLWRKAEALVSQITENGGNPDGVTWNCLAVGYCVGGKMDDAVAALKEAVTVKMPVGHKLKPETRTMAACIEHLKSQGEIEAAEEFLEKVAEDCHFPVAALNRLAGYLKDESQNALPLDEMGADMPTLGDKETAQ